MFQIKNYIVVLLAASTILLAACGASNTTQKTVTTTTQNTPKTEQVSTNNDVQTYEKFDEFEHHLHEKNNKTYVINFWATWCKPCVKELPYFEQIQAEYKDKNVEVVLVSLDDIRKLESKVIPFIQKNELQSTIILLDDADYNAWIDKVSPEWSGAIPVTLFYNKNKREFYEQEFDYQELENIVKRFSRSENKNTSVHQHIHTSVHECQRIKPV